MFRTGQTLYIDVSGVAEAVGVDWVSTVSGSLLADPVQADKRGGTGPELLRSVTEDWELERFYSQCRPCSKSH